MSSNNFMQVNCLFDKTIGNYAFNTSKLLGNGAFSKVYKGQENNSKTLVAVKVVDMALITHSVYSELLQSEIQVMKSVNHENCLKLLEVYNSPNNIYMITEFCQGGDLGEELIKRRRLSEEEVLKIVYDVCKGLKALSEHFIVHRDLKPANIFITQKHYKIGDFGFAKFMRGNSDQMSQALIGTPLYMSPQNLAKVPYSIKSDIWSLGVCFYELITGIIPWNCNSHSELLMAIQRYPFSFPLGVRISQESRNLISRCLQFEERNRISIQEILQHVVFDRFKKQIVIPRKSSISTNNHKKSSDYNESTPTNNPNVLDFLMVLAKNCEELSSNFEFKDFDLEKLSFLLTKFSYVSQISCKKVNTQIFKKTKFSLLEKIQKLKEKSLSKESPSFLDIFNENGDSKDEIKQMLKNTMKSLIRELNHYCLVKFLRENNSTAFPHLLVFLSALVDCYDILNENKNDLNVQQLLQKDENNVFFYKNIRKQILNLNIQLKFIQ